MKFDSIIFDLDSTLVKIEGLDYLAEIKELKKDIALLTKKAMDGKIPMSESMDKKLKILKPSYKDILKMGEGYLTNITTGAKETIKYLLDNKFKVWIITGNFQPAVKMLADKLEVPSTQVIANKMFFDKDGNYLDFDRNNPLSNNGGKVKIIQKYKKRLGKTVFIGDGSTDLETKPVVNLFIGFGGVVVRQKVKDNSNVFVANPDLRSIIPLIADL